jgi:exonuclease VII small subunit
VLFRLLRGRRDLPYPHLFVLFGLFILFCGTGHIIDIVTIWQPLYWLDAFWDFGTGVISIATAIVLWPLLPKLMRAGTIEEVLQRDTIDKLEQQNRDLDEANARMNQANQNLHGQMAAMREATRVLAEREARIRELRDELDAYKAKYGPSVHD